MSGIHGVEDALAEGLAARQELLRRNLHVHAGRTRLHGVGQALLTGWRQPARFEN